MTAAFFESDQDRVVVATFPNRVVADMAAGFLEGEDIETWVLADDAGGAYPVLQSLQGVRLLVAAEDEERAREMLAALQAAPVDEKDMLPDDEDGEGGDGADILPFPKINPHESD